MIDLILIGNGGHAKDILQIIRDINRGLTKFNIVGFLDDNPNTERLGSIEDYEKYIDYCQYIICVNDGVLRKKINDRIWKMALNRPRIKIPYSPSLIHPTAIVGDDCYYGDGLVMGPYSVLTTKINLGCHVHLNTHASINQNSIVGDYVTLSPGARICGDCKIGGSVNMGVNSSLINVKTVADNTVIGAGAVVIKDILEPGQRYVGVPAYRLSNSIEEVWG